MALKSFILRFLGQLITVAALILLSRHLGPREFGLYSVLYSIIVFFAVPLNVGLNHIIIREANTRRTETDLIFRAGYGLRLILALLSAIGAMIVMPLMKISGVSGIIIITVVLSLFFSLWQSSFRLVFEAPFEANQRMDLSSAVNLGGRFAILGLLIVGTLYGAGLAGIIVLQTIGEIIATGLFIVALWFAQYPFIPLFNKKEMLFQFKEALPLIIVDLLIIIQTRTDILLLKTLCDDTTVGLFTPPSRLVEALILIPTVLITVSLPVMSQLAKEDRQNFEVLFRRLLKLLLSIGIISAILITFLSNIIIQLMFGEQYTYSSAILSVLVWTTPLFFIVAGWSSVLVVIGKQRWQFVVMGTMAILNVILNILFIPKYSGVGAAWAKVITNASFLLIALIPLEIRREGYILINSTLMSLVIASGIVISALYFNLTTWWIGGLLSLLWVAIMYFSGWFNKNEIKGLLQSLSRKS